MTATRGASVLDDGFVRAGLALLVLGTGPLVAIILAAALGLTRDPNPNPIGPGMLAVVTFWPAVVLLALGLVRARRRGARWQWPTAWPGSAPWGGGHPPTALRVAAGVAALLMVVRGWQGLRAAEGRGAAALLVLAAALAGWALSGRIPSWLRR